MSLGCTVPCPQAQGSQEAGCRLHACCNQSNALTQGLDSFFWPQAVCARTTVRLYSDGQSEDWLWSEQRLWSEHMTTVSFCSDQSRSLLWPKSVSTVTTVGLWLWPQSLLWPQSVFGCDHSRSLLSVFGCDHSRSLAVTTVFAVTTVGLWLWPQSVFAVTTVGLCCDRSQCVLWQQSVFAVTAVSMCCDSSPSLLWPQSVCAVTAVCLCCDRSQCVLWQQSVFAVTAVSVCCDSSPSLLWPQSVCAVTAVRLCCDRSQCLSGRRRAGDGVPSGLMAWPSSRRRHSVKMGETSQITRCDKPVAGVSRCCRNDLRRLGGKWESRAGCCKCS